MAEERIDIIKDEPLFPTEDKAKNPVVDNLIVKNASIDVKHVRNVDKTISSLNKLTKVDPKDKISKEETLTFRKRILNSLLGTGTEISKEHTFLGKVWGQLLRKEPTPTNIKNLINTTNQPIARSTNIRPAVAKPSEEEDLSKLYDNVSNNLDSIKSIFTEAASSIYTTFTGPFSRILTPLFQIIKNPLATYREVKKKLSDLWKSTKDFFNLARGIFGRIGGGIAKFFGFKKTVGVAGPIQNIPAAVTADKDTTKAAPKVMVKGNEEHVVLFKEFTQYTGQKLDLIHKTLKKAFKLYAENADEEQDLLKDIENNPSGGGGGTTGLLAGLTGWLMGKGKGLVGGGKGLLSRGAGFLGRNAGMFGKIAAPVAAGLTSYQGIKEELSGKKVDSVIPKGFWNKLNPFEYAMNAGRMTGHGINKAYGAVSKAVGGEGELGSDIYDSLKKLKTMSTNYVDSFKSGAKDLKDSGVKIFKDVAGGFTGVTKFIKDKITEFIPAGTTIISILKEIFSSVVSAGAAAGRAVGKGAQFVAAKTKEAGVKTYQAAKVAGAQTYKSAKAGVSNLADLISGASKKHGVNENLLKSVVKQESGGDPNATSRVGAQGLMQLMPGTAKQLGVKNSYNPEENIAGGTKHLSYLLKKYNGDEAKALAAYNWGEGNVDRKGMDKLPRETRDYVTRIMADKARREKEAAVAALTSKDKKPTIQVASAEPKPATVTATPSLDMGGVIARTGAALVHKGEVVANQKIMNEIPKNVGDPNVVKALANLNKNITELFKSMNKKETGGFRSDMVPNMPADMQMFNLNYFG